MSTMTAEIGHPNEIFVDRCDTVNTGELMSHWDGFAEFSKKINVEGDLEFCEFWSHAINYTCHPRDNDEALVLVLSTNEGGDSNVLTIYAPDLTDARDDKEFYHYVAIWHADSRVDELGGFVNLEFNITPDEISKMLTKLIPQLDHMGTSPRRALQWANAVTPGRPLNPLRVADHPTSMSFIDETGEASFFMNDHAHAYEDLMVNLRIHLGDNWQSSVRWVTIGDGKDPDFWDQLRLVVLSSHLTPRGVDGNYILSVYEVTPPFTSNGRLTVTPTWTFKNEHFAEELFMICQDDLDALEIFLKMHSIRATTPGRTYSDALSLCMSLDPCDESDV